MKTRILAGMAAVAMAIATLTALGNRVEAADPLLVPVAVEVQFTELLTSDTQQVLKYTIGVSADDPTRVSLALRVWYYHIEYDYITEWATDNLPDVGFSLTAHDLADKREFKLPLRMGVWTFVCVEVWASPGKGFGNSVLRGQHLVGQGSDCALVD